ncbi:MAG: RnfABCDGE type electron transport complex subunit G [Clostridia bacterium]|nr:RnfABCDGE type electron transport complex subunit G [Clostridia bacterium]
MKKFKEYAAPTVVLLIICVVAALLLAVTNDVTAPKIAQVNAENEANARREVFVVAADFGEETITADGIKLVPALDANGETIGYVVITVEKGYGGDISVMTGVDLEGKVTGVKPLEMNETPGLGANATKDSFLQQFVGKVAGIGVTKDAPEENEIKALTGATITSKAITDAVNAAIEAMGGENVG